MPAWGSGTRSRTATRGLQLSSECPPLGGLGLGLTRVEERGSRPQSADIHHGVEGQQDEEGQGAQRGDVGDGPGDSGRLRAWGRHGCPPPPPRRCNDSGASAPTRGFCLLE